MLAAWLRGVNLGAPTTMKAKPWDQLWTRKLCGNGAKRQIDYIFTNEVRIDDVGDFDVLGIMDGKSDHRGEACDFSLLHGRGHIRGVCEYSEDGSLVLMRRAHR